MQARAGRQAEEFANERELGRLLAVREAGATEAVVFYAARILEAKAGDALVHLGSRPSGNLFGSLRALENFEAFPKAIGYFAHTIRRLGNEVRHVGREIGKSDADTSVALLSRFLDWFTERFSGDSEATPGQGSLARLERAFDPALREVLAALTRNDLDRLAVLWRGGANESFAAGTPVLAALYADLSLDRARSDAALSVLLLARERFPADLRLRQLHGLTLSRMKRLAEAVDVLSPVFGESPDDEETAGIFAGALKRLWESGPVRELEALRRAHRIYRKGWERAGSPWLGVNAATTALYLEDGKTSREIAGRVREQIVSSQRRLGEDMVARLFGARGVVPEPEGGVLAQNYWDTVTQAELELLLGNRDRAARIYRDAILASTRNKGAIEVTRAQLARILPLLGFTGTVEHFFGAVVLGVTGHRRLEGSPVLRAAVREALEGLPARLGRAGPVPYHALSPIAEGADRLVAEEVLARPDSSLEVLLPLPEEDYQKDFETEESRARFRELLDRAVASATLPAARSREAAYEAAGRAVVDRSDVLLALWDGGPSRGRGGTAEIVAYAREKGKPLVWIRTAPPEGTEYERMGPAG